MGVTSSLDYRPLLQYARGSYKQLDPKHHPYMPLWHVDESRLQDSRTGADLRVGANEFLLWRFRDVSGGAFSGHILARADVGSIERIGVPHFITGKVPWIALSKPDDPRNIWLDNLVRHEIPAWFTIFGSDTRAVFEPPTVGKSGLLVFRLHRRLV
jgi:hypothetical protein